MKTILFHELIQLALSYLPCVCLQIVFLSHPVCVHIPIQTSKISQLYNTYLEFMINKVLMIKFS